MSLMPSRSEKRPPIVGFRCPTALRERIDARSRDSGHSRSKVMETVLSFGLDLWAALEPEWERLEALAKERGESFAETVLRLVRAGMAASKSKR